MGQNEPSILGKAAGAVCVALRVQEWGEEKGDYPERTVQRGNQTKKRVCSKYHKSQFKSKLKEPVNSSKAVTATWANT